MSSLYKNTDVKREWVLHIDGDAFFASVEVSRRPDLFGKPVVVGEERGIATALTYPAKNLGIKRGDPIFRIKKDFPEVTILSSHFELYRKFAYNLAQILIPEVEKFEAYSIDECFATVTGTEEEIKEKIKNLKTLIQNKIGITYSFGVSQTKTLAKVASKMNKPNGLCFLLNKQEIDEALKKTNVENIWGVGWATSRKLKNYKIKNAYELIINELPKSLRNNFSKNIFQTIEELMGIKHFEVGGENAHKKSIQSTRTFLQKTNTKKTLYGEISRNVEIACGEMRKENLLTRNIHIFLKPADKGQNYFEKSFELPYYTNSEITIMKCIEHTFDNSLIGCKTLYKKSGVTVFNLLAEEELVQDLFHEQENILKEENKVTDLIDGLRNKYGFAVIGLASSIETNNNRSTDYTRRHRTDNYESGLPYPYLGIANLNK